MSAILERIGVVTTNYPDAEFEMITPKMATTWLKANTDNRRQRPGTIDKYSRDMINGDWHANGDAIRFDETGKLLDGQHRLAACVKANKPFVALVVRGLSASVRVSIDSGAKRSFTDVLRFNGEKSVAQLGAAVTWCWRYENSNMKDTQSNPSFAELEAWLENNPRIRDSVGLAASVRARVRLSQTTVAGVHYETTLVDESGPADADEFFSRLASGEGLEPGSAILALRRWVERSAGRRDKPAPVVYSAITIKALNYWRSGKETQTIGWRAGGATAEPFPRILPVE